MVPTHAQLSVADLQKLNVKPQIEARLKELEEETKGWFPQSVPDADRLKEPAPKKAAGGGGGGGGAGGGGAWGTVPSRGGGGRSGGGGGGGGRSANPWAALG